MKYNIAILVLISAGLLSKINAETWIDIERYWTISPPNSVLFTTNQSESVQKIEIKKEITIDRPLYLRAAIYNTVHNNLVHKDHSEINMCAEYEKSTFQSTAVRFFAKALMPGSKEGNYCPIRPQKYEVRRRQGKFKSFLNLSPGSYEFEYDVISADHEDVFKPVKFKFYVWASNGGFFF